MLDAATAFTAGCDHIQCHDQRMREGPDDRLEIPGRNPEDPVGDPKPTNESLEAAGGRSRSIGEGQGMEA